MLMFKSHPLRVLIQWVEGGVQELCVADFGDWPAGGGQTTLRAMPGLQLLRVSGGTGLKPGF